MGRHRSDSRSLSPDDRRRHRRRSRSRSPQRSSRRRARSPTPEKRKERSSHKESTRRSPHRDRRTRDSPRERDRPRRSPERRPKTEVKREKFTPPQYPNPEPPVKNDEQPTEEPVEKEKPSLKPSGKLLEDTNMVNGVVVKYVEPPEAKVPRALWQLHPFRNQEGKDPEPLPVMHIHRRSCYLIGRDRKVVHFPMDHPSCSKQHAALQFRSLPYTKPTGERSRRTKPYLIDLESANGTYINDEKIEPTRYYELQHGDEIRFGFSSRSFVILNATAALAIESNVKKEDESDDEEPEVAVKKMDEDKFE